MYNEYILVKSFVTSKQDYDKNRLFIRWNTYVKNIMTVGF